MPDETFYDLIYADPPTSFRNWSQKGENRHAKRHYDLMSDADLLAYFGADVADLAATDAVLMLWATGPRLPFSLALMEAAGFEYKGLAFTWAKLLKRWSDRLEDAVNDGPAITNLLATGFWHIGMGYTTRANAEFVLYGSRGQGLPRQDKGVRSLVVRPVGRHSAKPPAVRARLEKLYGDDVKRIELFARERVPGWDAIGDELE